MKLCVYKSLLQLHCFSDGYTVTIVRSDQEHKTDFTPLAYRLSGFDHHKLADNKKSLVNQDGPQNVTSSLIQRRLHSDYCKGRRPIRNTRRTSHH
ncbi:hypothetical protein GDO78_000318 [Eleutherodactylus coqui]|uniref:Uncharacterized protein n=1 Tax=Eleutherodactylus coqui TaxID=57060 RepID=A0A8J6FS01_ELECQ|nr:hypothetical protein GDO78_000318 [Eleutherodactylus coqui]